MKKSSIEKNCKCCDKKISKVKKVILKKYNAQLYTGYNYSNEFVRIKIVPTKPIGKAKEITVINYTSYIQCVAPLSLIRDIGFIITNDQVIQFNRFVDDLFEEYLYIFVQKNTKQNQRYCGFKEAIELFAQIHNIEIDVDITFDTLKKAEYRHRKNIEKKLVASLSPQIIKNQVIQQTLFLV